jgi:hypothetical protein
MATEKDAVAEIVEKYDLNNTEGFGDEGEDETGLDGFGEEGAEESGGFGEEV